MYRPNNQRGSWLSRMVTVASKFIRGTAAAASFTKDKIDSAYQKNVVGKKLERNQHGVNITSVQRSSRRAAVIQGNSESVSSLTVQERAENLINIYCPQTLKGKTVVPTIQMISRELRDNGIDFNRDDSCIILQYDIAYLLAKQSPNLKIFENSYIYIYDPFGLFSERALEEYIKVAKGVQLISKSGRKDITYEYIDLSISEIIPMCILPEFKSLPIFGWLGPENCSRLVADGVIYCFYQLLFAVYGYLDQNSKNRIDPVNLSKVRTPLCFDKGERVIKMKWSIKNSSSGGG